MKVTLTVEVQPPYPVHMGNGLFDDAALLNKYIHGSERPVLITDTTVHALYGARIQSHLAHRAPLVLTFPAGEAHKTRATKEMLEDAMLGHGCNRDTCIIALGGGVASDMAGFVAATYCRGVPVVYLPTTLLAMVDAGVGGKTAVNTPLGKNMIGAFHQPRAVIMDVDCLHSLPDEEINNGFAEMLKHALIDDAPQLAAFRSHHVSPAHTDAQNSGESAPAAETHWLLRDTPWLIHTLAANIAVKKRRVEADERDNGARHALNFGHTIGHAVEQLSGYTVAHGHAVAVGMLVETHIALLEGLITQADCDAIAKALSLCGFPLQVPWLGDTNAVLQVLQLDKKAQSNAIRCVLLQGLGVTCPEGSRPVSKKHIRRALDWYNAL